MGLFRPIVDFTPSGLASSPTCVNINASTQTSKRNTDMANFKKVNLRIKKEFPCMDIEVVRGVGYFYYSGDHGESLDSVMAHPVSTSTDEIIKMAIADVYDRYGD